jgi:23S rRNA (uracil1939-C5)-methyltransferase
VHADRANRIAFALTDTLARAGVAAAGPRLSGVVRHLIVRVSLDESEAAAVLVVTRNDRSLRKPIRAFLDSPDRPTGFYVNVHDGSDAFMLGPDTLKIAGHDYVMERSLETPFLISPTAFFQTNVSAARVLLQEVSNAVLGGRSASAVRASRPRILDLYAGAGLFSVPLAVRGCRVTAVEENRAAARDAVANGRLNRLADADLRVITARVEDALPRLSRTPFQAVVLDPPRQGCPRRVLEVVFDRMAAPVTVYVSCNVQALAGELPHIVRSGYQIARVQPVDMFPHTDHIETVVTLERVA